MAVWSAATGLRASPTCAASPRQQEQQEAKWRRIRGGVERSDRKKRGGGITAASRAAGRDHCDGINSRSYKIMPSLLERQEALRELEIVLGDAATSG